MQRNSDLLLDYFDDGSPSDSTPALKPIAVETQEPRVSKRYKIIDFESPTVDSGYDKTFKTLNPETCSPKSSCFSAPLNSMKDRVPRFNKSVESESEIEYLNTVIRDLWSQINVLQHESHRSMYYTISGHPDFSVISVSGVWPSPLRKVTDQCYTNAYKRRSRYVIQI